jgi:hypothetical protein
VSLCFIKHEVLKPYVSVAVEFCVFLIIVLLSASLSDAWICTVPSVNLSESEGLISGNLHGRSLTIPADTRKQYVVLGFYRILFVKFHT